MMTKWQYSRIPKRNEYVRKNCEHCRTLVDIVPEDICNMQATCCVCQKPIRITEQEALKIAGTTLV